MGVRFVEQLAGFGDRTALVVPAPDGGAGPAACVRVSYADLAALVEQARQAFGGTRRLVLLEAAATLDAVVAYLGALAGGHPVLLAPDGATTALDRLAQQYDPDVTVRTATGHRLEEHRPGTAHDLHPDLALLLGTSGSSGSPKLVRLSAAGVDANARSVAQALGLTADDRALTTLPLAYCYGLSVLHSHLAVGAGVVLSGWSVLDEELWRAVGTHGVTNLAGVPHTFDLLDRAGFAERHCPALRLVTQAGGRMAPDRVRDVAALGARRGFDLVVMYGQTEATARMACLPAGTAARRPDAVGVAVPGGRIRVLTSDEGTDDVEAAPGEVGEVVYEGPNVMLGYAHSPADLALGRTTHRLRTGDLGRVAADGLLELTGRRSNLVKVAGMRVDLERVDADLAELGLAGLASGTDGRLDVAVECCAHPAMVRSLLASSLSLPPSAVRVVAVDALPRTTSGKPDRAAVTGLADAVTVPARCLAAGCVEGCPPAPERPADGADLTARLVALYAEMLDRPDTDETSTFTSLGGDSLSYVALSVRLEDALGDLPDGWATTPVRDLARQARTRTRWAGVSWARVETGVVLRCLAIIAVVGTHANLFTLRGGAHLLLAVAGFQAARFTFARTVSGTATTTRTADHARRTLRTLRRIAVPTVAWVGGLAAVGLYPWTTALLLTSVAGPDRWGPAWHYWFVEALVWILAATGLLLAVPAVRAVRDATPFAFAVGLVAVGLLPRFDVVHVWTGPERGTAQYVFWLFALGWAVAEARTTRQRLVVSALAAASVPGFFDAPGRDAVVLAGILALTWIPAVRLPRATTGVVGVVASSSLFTYLTQWQVFPHLRDVPLVALVVCLAVGAATWALAERLRRAVAAGQDHRTPSPHQGEPREAPDPRPRSDRRGRRPADLGVRG